MKAKILIVDDHQGYALALAESLRQHGYEALTTQDPQEVVSIVEREKPQLILLDIMMPKKGGTELRADLLSNSATRAIPIIFLTGLKPPQYSSSAQKQPKKSAIIRTVGKSGDLKELLGAINDILPRSIS